MKVTPLLGDDIVQNGANLEVIIDHTDLTEATAETAQTIALLSLKGLYEMVELKRFELLEAFQDTADAANNNTAFVVGDGGSTNRLLTSTVVNVNGTEVLIKAGTGTKHVFSADDTVDVVVAAPPATKTLAALNKGKARFLFDVYDVRIKRAA